MSAEQTPAAPAPTGTVRALWNGWQGRLLRTLLAVLPLVWLSRRVRWSEVGHNALTVGPLWLSLSLGAMLMSFLAVTVRWRALMLCYGVEPARVPPFLTLLRYFFVGHYFAVLPSGLIGEGVRGARVEHLFPDRVTSYVVLFIDRLGGLVGLLMLAGVAAVLSPGTQHNAVTSAINVGLGAAVPLTLLILAVPQVRERVPRLYSLLTRVPLGGPLLKRIPRAVAPGYFSVVLVMSLIAQGSAVLFVGTLLIPLVPVAPADVLWASLRVVPAIILVTFVPLTPGGVGQREVAFATLFGLTAVPAPAAVTASLLIFGEQMVLALCGGALLLWERSGRLRA